MIMYQNAAILSNWLKRLPSKCTSRLQNYRGYFKNEFGLIYNYWNAFSLEWLEAVYCVIILYQRT